VGVYSRSDLDYHVNIYALGRLGYTSFLISPRLPPSAVSSLLTSTEAHILFHAPECSQIAEDTKHLTTHPIQNFCILSRSIYDNPNDTSPSSPAVLIPLSNTIDVTLCSILLDRQASLNLSTTPTLDFSSHASHHLFLLLSNPCHFLMLTA
jgi:hypothetical protein